MQILSAGCYQMLPKGIMVLLLQHNDTKSKQHICGVDLTFTRQDLYNGTEVG